MNIAVFFDRDGTINKIESNETEFVTSYEKFEFYEDAADAIKILKNLGLKVIITTNQPSVARGLCTEKQVENLHDLMLKDLKKAGAFVDAVYFCPHHPETYHKDIKHELMKYRIDCDCRKPKIGMMVKAAAELSIDIKKSFVIGDRTVDIQQGKNAGTKTILVKTGMSGRDKKYNVEADFRCNNLMEAAKLIERNFTTKAVILAGGKGERLMPLTKDIPKPMIEVGDKPIMQHHIELLKKHGITDLIVCGSYLVEKIKHYFGNGTRFGVSIEYIDEPEPLGTGGALRLCNDMLSGSKSFVVMNGDVAVDNNFDVSSLVHYHESKGGIVTVVVRQSDHPQDSDILKLDGDCRVVDFIGRGQHIYKTANVGIFAASPRLLDFIPKDRSNVEKDVIFKIIDAEKVYAFIMPETWFVKDMGTHERLALVRRYFESVS